MVEFIHDATAFLSDVAVIAAAIYVSANKYKYGLQAASLLWVMSIASVTWSNIPLWINDIIYDFSYIFVAFHIITNCSCFNQLRKKLSVCICGRVECNGECVHDIAEKLKEGTHGHQR